MKPYYQDSAVTIYHGDCREIVGSLNAIDLIISDPPYGISLKTNGDEKIGKLGYSKITGDDKPFSAEFWTSFKWDSVWFGANNYHHSLPEGGGWLVWDKRSPDGSSDNVFGWPFELAWCSRNRFARIYRIQHGGYLNADSPGDRRYHPTQKPVKLLTAVLSDFKGHITLDPFMGSGTTLRAAKDLGRKAIGIEIEERYCEIAAKRMAQEVLAL